ncbi:hypothetical protein [Rhodopseudomonas palustris]|uniref:hypothetical protein n=1 Tax=Rhodopseudomonas palustris TaxID=1076 RepID=UPI0002E05071
MIVLIGLLLSNAETLAVTAPLTADAHEEMLASKPIPKPATPAAARAPVGNPLWAIPLARLTATRERPLFAPSRRPAVVAKPAPAPAATPPKPAEPDQPQLSLVGTVAGGGVASIGLFVNQADKSVVRLKIGETHKGWVLRAVRPRQAVLGRGLQNAVLDLPQPDMSKAGAVPPAGRANVAAPPSSSLPANSPNPPGRNSPPPRPSAASAAPTDAAQIIEPPVLSPRPPPANRVQKVRLP